MEEPNNSFSLGKPNSSLPPEQQDPKTRLSQPYNTSTHQGCVSPDGHIENLETEHVSETRSTNDDPGDPANGQLKSDSRGTRPPFLPHQDKQLSSDESSSDEEEVEDFEHGKLEERIKKAPKRLLQASQYKQLLEDRVASLEKRLQELDGHDELTTNKKDKASAAENKPTIPEIRRVKWTEFKNKYKNDNMYALEVLVGGARYWYQRRKDEQVRRWNLGNEGFLEDFSTSSAGLSESESQVPERVRINSKPLLTILSDIASEDWNMEPRVFLRPYKLFICHENEIRDFYKKLEIKWAKSGGATKNSSDDIESTSNMNAVDFSDNQRVQGTNSSDHNDRVVGTLPGTMRMSNPIVATEEQLNKEGTAGARKANSEGLVGTLEAFKDLKCLVDFMDTDLAPIIQAYQDTTNRKIRFQDLFFLFKPGQEIYAPKKRVLEGDGSGKPLKATSLERYQTAYRVIHCSGGRPFLNGNNTDNSHISLKDRMDSFDLFCYYIDFNGSEFSPCYHGFSIAPYEGEREITSLEIYPWQYAERKDALRETLRERGEKFRSFIKAKHMYYNGSTLESYPNGGEIEGEPLLHSETVDSEVIVDFAQGIEAHPDWVIEEVQTTSLTESERLSSEDYPTRLWKDRDHRDRDHRNFILKNRPSKQHAQQKNETIFVEYIHREYESERGIFIETISKDPFLNSDETSGESDPRNKHFRDQDLILLPSRVIGYVLRNRRWALLNINHLRPVKAKSEGFNSLKLPRGHKAMVKALVQSHSMKAEVNEYNDDIVDYDVVRGKGRGLIILLHGVPGVGKTSTAECVAESTGKPLFPITCGDLGTEPGEVEDSLREKFHLAQVWDCVLLIDEADVFLAERSRTDLKRNALVSIFLRVMEYYTGILFLTTNRVGSLDEAFKSRIHISLYYPPLAKKQTELIWQMNLERTKKLDLKRSNTSTIPIMHIKEEEIMHKGRWNGR
ncbi:uncharacterized protein K441DRAFT_706219 [Cenococcum geophilum 1.58]|uniref:uncharacterized protein n=1 Tax=Cenococcum geophilum 1.58 TaxID=794803 RepID=UPI00358EB715|nr:hypothetical protein K441DRAFT_706219 [Cenococcum geophilum 1.58]